MDQDTTIALLPSPLLGPAVWQPVQQALSADGLRVIVPGRPGRLGTVADVCRWYLNDLPEDHDYVLVPHSNAGLYIPALTQRRSVTGLVFVDAILPPRSGEFTVAPDGLLTMLGELADDEGTLPPWTSWWDEETVVELFPSTELRQRVEAEQTRFPLSYFQETIGVERDWATLPAMYVAFGDTYEVERAEAQAWGWPTQVLAGNHMHMLAQPGEVAAAISQGMA
jgi:hypothetical protein